MAGSFRLNIKKKEVINVYLSFCLSTIIWRVNIWLELKATAFLELLKSSCRGEHRKYHHVIHLISTRTNHFQRSETRHDPAKFSNILAVASLDPSNPSRNQVTKILLS